MRRFSGIALFEGVANVLFYVLLWVGVYVRPRHSLLYYFALRLKYSLTARFLTV